MAWCKILRQSPGGSFRDRVQSGSSCHLGITSLTPFSKAACGRLLLFPFAVILRSTAEESHGEACHEILRLHCVPLGMTEKRLRMAKKAQDDRKISVGDGVYDVPQRGTTAPEKLGCRALHCSASRAMPGPTNVTPFPLSKSPDFLYNNLITQTKETPL